MEEMVMDNVIEFPNNEEVLNEIKDAVEFVVMEPEASGNGKSKWFKAGVALVAIGTVALVGYAVTKKEQIDELRTAKAIKKLEKKGYTVTQNLKDEDPVVDVDVDDIDYEDYTEE